MSQNRITAIVLTFNEALHIERCLARLKPIADRIVVIDSFSTDATVALAQAAGAEVLQNPFVNHAAQFQWGVDAAGIADGWILRIDCDEYLEPALIDEIREKLPDLPPEVSAIEMRRKVFFQGKWIRWGGYYRVVLTRLWRVGTARIEQRWMDEHIEITRGKTIWLRKGDLVDDNLKDITWWTEKHNGYTTRQMIEFINLEFPLFEANAAPGALSAKVQRKRFMRNAVYARAPLYARALAYYLQRYFLRLGFLDGRKGFVFHTLQGFWNFLLMDAKVEEAREYIRTHGVAAFRQHVRDRYGIDLSGLDDRE